MRRLYIFGLITLAAIIIGFAWADDITLTTYYPAPYGVYNDMVVMNSLGIGTTSPGAKLDVRGQVIGGFGAVGTGGIASWNDSTNARSGNGYTLLTASATGGPHPGGHYYHPLSFEYSSKDGSGNMTQFAIPYYANYGDAGDNIFMRSRYSGVWYGWRKILSEDANGRVGIGTTTPASTLTIAGTTWCTSGVWDGSDIRWKENVETLANPLEKVLKLRGIRFDWKREEFEGNNFPKGRQIGIIAQELEKEFPELVTTDGDGYSAIAYDRLTAVLLEAIKAQQQEIEGLKQQISRLKGIVQAKM